MAWCPATGSECGRRSCARFDGIGDLPVFDGEKRLVGPPCELLLLHASPRPRPRGSSLNTLFEVRARSSLVYVLLFLSASLLTWLLVR